MTKYILHSGAHKTFEDGHCLMEVVAHLAGEKHSDAPKCACQVLSAFGRRLNDKFPDDESRTKHLGAAASLLVNSKDETKEKERAFLLADLAVRRWLPLHLEKLGKKDEAQKMRELDRIVDEKSAYAAWFAGNIVARGGKISHYIAHYAAANAAHAAAAANAACSPYAAQHVANAAAHGANAASGANALEDAAACFMAILKGEDPWKIPLPEQG